MKPIRLEIEGVNSFLEKQVVDFSAVLQEGIFGVFGNTGSGKSTILDAITLALYSKTQKNNKKDEYVNCKAKKAAVSFLFEILYEGRRRTFEFCREIFSGKRAGSACAYEYVGDEKLLLEDKSDNVSRLAERIVGLTFDDFNKCIALPQGEFARFAKSADAERLDIVARLFSLEKYGAQLYAKASAKANALESERDKLQAELSGYAEYGEEAKSALQREIAEKTEALEGLRKRNADVKRRLAEEEELCAAAREIAALRQELAALDGRKAEMKRAADRLENADLYDALYDAEEENKSAHSSLAEREKQVLSLRGELLRETEREKVLRADDWERTAETRAAELSGRIALLKNAEADAAAAEKLAAETEKLREEYRKADAENKKTTLLLQNAKERLETNAALLETLGEERDLYEAVTAGAKSACVREEYTFLKGENERRAERAIWLEKIIEEKLAAAKGGERVGDIEKLLAEEKEKNARRKRAAEAKIRLAEEYADALRRSGEQSAKLAALAEKGKSLAAELESRRAAVEKLTGGVNYRSALAEAEREIAEIREKTEKRRKETEQTAERIRALSEKIAVSEKEIENFKNKIYETGEKSKKILAKCGIMNKDAALLLRLGEKDKAKLKEEVAAFAQKSAVAESKLAEKQAFLQGRTADEEKRAALKRESEEGEGAAERLNGEILAARTRLAICEEKSGIKNRLEEALALVLKRYDVAKLLQSIVKARQFLKYVANEYLEEITFAASATLLKLSSGNYGLRYKEEFFVTDNKNGGKERSVNTLSGGETFLVSLSLAFALSAAICARSDRPIEFFFLDEGFGTLDEELVETVLDSLEKFKSEKFSIGIISHVKELKERINCKILVKGATETEGSRIEIAY